jgi:hypothetical protein
MISKCFKGLRSLGSSVVTKYISIHGIPMTKQQYVNAQTKASYLEDVSDCIEFMSDIPVAMSHISRAAKTIADKNRDLHKVYWDTVYPFIKENAMNTKPNHAKEIAYFIYGFGKKAVQDDELWESLESKLYTYKNLHFYMSYEEIACVLYGFAFARRGNTKTFDMLIDYLALHHLNLDEPCKDKLTECLEICNYRTEDIRELSK